MLAMTVTGVYSGETPARDTLQPIAAAESLHGVANTPAGSLRPGIDGNDVLAIPAHGRVRFHACRCSA